MDILCAFFALFFAQIASAKENKEKQKTLLKHILKTKNRRIRHTKKYSKRYAVILPHVF
jgi:hypothetical protein